MCVSLRAGDMSESKAHRVEIREVDGQTLRKLVDYIYTAEIEVTEDNVQVRVWFCFSVFQNSQGTYLRITHLLQGKEDSWKVLMGLC